MKRILRFSLLLLFLLILSVISGPENHTARMPVCRFVTQAEVTFRHGEYTLAHTYTRPDKISFILNYLRTTDPHGQADTDPEELGGDSYLITLQYSDGSTGQYRQQAYQYFSKNEQPWQKIYSNHAQLLYPLIHLLPSDL